MHTVEETLFNQVKACMGLIYSVYKNLTLIVATVGAILNQAWLQGKVERSESKILDCMRFGDPSQLINKTRKCSPTLK
jgi:hypothetical protein